jgi:hypothetical protein
MLKMLNSKAPQKALIKFFIKNPSTISDVKYISKALITKVKSPSVKTFIGKVQTSSIGFTKEFKSVNTNEDAAKTPKVFISSPERIFATTKSISVLNINLTINLEILNAVF